MRSRRLNPCENQRQAQAAVEYLLVLGMVVVVVMLSFKTWFPSAQKSTEGMYNAVTSAIMGEPPPD